MSSIKERIKYLIKEFFNSALCKIYKEKDPSWITYHTRPFNANAYKNFTPDFVKGKRVAILLQGNIMYKNDFTYETIKLYQKLYPNSYIILSTWQYENEECLQKMRDLGVHIVQSELPNKRGHGNLNYQLKSTQEGLAFARSLNAEYVLKTRTDQRLCASGSITYMMNLILMYPRVRNDKFFNRLVICSNGCFWDRLYNVSDMVVFGATSEVELYFSAPFDTREEIDYPQNNQEEYSKNRPGEIYISTHYIEKLGHSLEWTKEDSVRCFKELFIIVDSESLDWVWPKYNNKEYRWRQYKTKKLLQITHKDWVNLYMEDKK